MNEAEQNSQKQRKKIIKKYILHQKANPRLLGVELFNRRIETPYEAFLSCKLIFKKDVRSLMELEQVAKRIYEGWTKQNDELMIKKINVFTSTAYIVLTFTIGFHEETQVKSLRSLKECAKEIIETYDDVSKKEREAEYKRKEAELYGVVKQFNQLTKKLDGIEDRLTKNESIVLDSGELLKTELTKVSKTLREQMNQEERQQKQLPKVAAKRERQITRVTATPVKSQPEKKQEIDEKKLRIQKYQLSRSKQQSELPTVKKGTVVQLPQKNIATKEVMKKDFSKGYMSKLESEIVRCFTESTESTKKRMVQKKQFLMLKTKVEFIDYLWMLLELDGKEEIIIANKLSCRELVEELGQFLETIEKVATGPIIFNYWIYCSQEILIKLEGYAALKDFLNSTLNLENDLLVNEV